MLVAVSYHLLLESFPSLQEIILHHLIQTYHVDVHVQTPPSQQTQPQEQWPSIAEQFDGRLTNIFRNTWEGIL